LPQTPLGKLTALLRLSNWILGESYFFSPISVSPPFLSSLLFPSLTFKVKEGKGRRENREKLRGRKAKKEGKEERERKGDEKGVEAPN